MRILVVCLLAVVVAAEQKREAGYLYRLAHGGASRSYQSPSHAYYHTPRTSYYRGSGYGHAGTSYITHRHPHAHVHTHNHAHSLTPYQYHHLQKREAEADPGYVTPTHYSGGHHVSGHRAYTPHTLGGTHYGYQTSVHHPGHGYSYQARQGFVAAHHHAHPHVHAHAHPHTHYKG